MIEAHDTFREALSRSIPAFIDRVTEVVQVRTGQSGDPLDALVQSWLVGTSIIVEFAQPGIAIKVLFPTK